MVPEDEYIVFLAKDSAFLPTLRFYREECVRQGADAVQVEAVDKAILRVEEWRAANPSRCKVPDAAGERMLDVTSFKNPYAGRQHVEDDIQP